MFIWGVKGGEFGIISRRNLIVRILVGFFGMGGGGVCQGRMVVVGLFVGLGFLQFVMLIVDLFEDISIRIQRLVDLFVVDFGCDKEVLVFLGRFFGDNKIFGEIIEEILISILDVIVLDCIYSVDKGDLLESERLI